MFLSNVLTIICPDLNVDQIGTYFLEKRAQTLEAEGELQAINDIDRLQVVMHLWEFEASFAASRQKTLDVYMEAYRWETLRSCCQARIFFSAYPDVASPYTARIVSVHTTLVKTFLLNNL